MRAVVRLFGVWWSADVEPESHVRYFAHRGLLDGIQLLIGACTLVFAIVPLISQFSPSGPTTHVTWLVSCALALSALIWTGVWWFGPWPSRGWSILFTVYADVGITVVALTYSNRLAGMFGLNVLVLVSVYAKFFETPKVLALHTVIMLLAVGVFGVSIATGPAGDPYLATANVLIAVVSLLVTPVVIQFGIWMLRNDANDSMTDELTGLLNRRGLNFYIAELVGDRDRDGGDSVMAVVVDLDRFKLVNDSFGHATGDAVLVRSARRIVHSVRGSALVARTGGEEFVVVDIAAPEHTRSIAERIRAAIAAPVDIAPVTASVGVASMPLAEFRRSGAEPSAVLAEAIERADRAMFDANEPAEMLPRARPPPRNRRGVNRIVGKEAAAARRLRWARPDRVKGVVAPGDARPRRRRTRLAWPGDAQETIWHSPRGTWSRRRGSV
ncbi:GGDEF domain-containing protein [Mycolicibacterium sp. J2]|uniref:GGDEF domain-containing protein n=1 Tax=Mycolicibacterium sp. J2 TaxID=2993511 RepID=UPI00224AC02C|nr:GGDEF domain-containing protein [Mycolicibacterium sp. J2]MCX2710963.1 GGDEF domain-containing protein [Mycolicibacterium sp. J2]